MRLLKASPNGEVVSPGVCVPSSPVFFLSGAVRGAVVPGRNLAGSLRVRALQCSLAATTCKLHVLGGGRHTRRCAVLGGRVVASDR